VENTFIFNSNVEIFAIIVIRTENSRRPGKTRGGKNFAGEFRG